MFFLHREGGDEVEKLVDQPHLAAAEEGGLGGVQRTHLHPVDEDLPGGGPVHPGQQMQQGGFARTGSPHHGHKGPPLHHQVDAVQGTDGGIPLAVHFFQIGTTQQFHEMSSFGVHSTTAR